jgi:hypothetical protein
MARVDYAGVCGPCGYGVASRSLLVSGNEGQFGERCQVTVLVLQMLDGLEGISILCPCHQSGIPMVISNEKESTYAVWHLRVTGALTVDARSKVQ